LLIIFWILIHSDNITFKLQFLEYLNGEGKGPKDYDDFKKQKETACLIGAVIYAVIWVLSFVSIKITGRNLSQQSDVGY
jgi:hypothetical protein